MSATMKGKYEVIRMLRASVLAGLSAFGMSDVGCMEFAQPILQSADNVVLVKMAGMNRVGWQRSDYEKETTEGATEPTWYRVESWIEEQKWELTVIRKRDGQPVTAETVTAEDVAYALVAWFNGQGGIESFRNCDCANLFVNPADVKPYKDDSGLYQNTASFTLALQVPKIFRFRQDLATPVFKKMIGV